ncbi:MAG: ABC transporter permease [Bacteroidota bacterium]
MLTHYLKTAFRNFLRHRVSFIINLVGLTTGLSCALFIFLWVADELSFDKFHEKDDRLFRVMEFQTYSDYLGTTLSTPGILAENLKVDYPEIQYAATTTWINANQFSYEDKLFKEDGWHAGEDFFNIFSFPLLIGDPDQVLRDKTSVCISRDMALRFFGSPAEAMGKTLRYLQDRPLQVTGVFENIPANSTYVFDFVIPFEDYKERNSWVESWGNNGPRTFVILAEGARSEDVTAKIATYVAERSENSNVELFLKKYSESYLYGSYNNGVPDGGRIEYVRLFSAIAIFILIIACINFMNLSTARASKRAHEVGVRKAVGAGRKSLIGQYLGESLLIAFVSLLFSLVIVALGLDTFNEMTDKSIVLQLSPELIAAALFTAAVTGLLAGSYPAFYLSSFRPVAVLKGEIKTSPGELWARRGLVVFQFWLTIVLMAGVFVIYKQIQFVFNKNLGYDQENVVMFEQEGKVDDARDTFLNELERLPGVVSAAAIGHTLTGQNSNTSGLVWPGKGPEERILFENIRVSSDLFETMGFEMVQGRPFSREFGADTARIIINEAGLKVMGLEDPIGVHIKLWEEYDMEIVGIVKDFHFQSLHTEVNPAFFTLSDNTWNVAVRLKPGDQGAYLTDVQALYNQFNPGFVFEPQFLDEDYQALYAAEQRVGKLSSYFAAFAILISCLGLFGLAAFTAERRLKEIGIRKVLGATVTNIVVMLSADFTKLVLVATVFAIPMAYYLLNLWLEDFKYRIALDWWIFGGAAVVALLIAWVTVGSQAFRAAQTNPARCLKDE